MNEKKITLLYIAAIAFILLASSVVLQEWIGVCISFLIIVFVLRWDDIDKELEQREKENQ